jgi:2-iminobutanoate/2-iminopropanoate deaminase
MSGGHIVSIGPEWEWERDMPPAPAVRYGNTLYLSGQIALGPDGKLVGEGDVTAQAHQCFKNISSVLARAGGSMSDVVKLVTYFACPMTDKVRTDYWLVRKQYFGTYRPASTGLQVSALIYPSVMLEIETVACLPDLKAE